MSVVVVATIVPVPAHRADVVAALEHAIAAVHTEDEGCELYALHEGEDRLVMIEKWTTDEALTTHGNSAALQKLNRALAGKVAGTPEVLVLHARPAGTPEQGTI